jgi:hypothetical protein
MEQPRYQTQNALDSTSCVILDYSGSKAFSEIVRTCRGRDSFLNRLPKIYNAVGFTKGGVVNTRVVFGTLLVAALALPLLAQGPRRDGRWEVKMEMDMPGMPANMPPMTTTQCITPDDAKDPQKAMPQGGGGRGNPADCKVTDYKVEGNKVSWSMKCEGAQPFSGTSEFVYSGDTYTGTMKMDGGRGAMTMKYTGKRLGDCVR